MQRPETIPFPGMPKPEIKRLAGDGTGRDLEQIKALSAKYNS